MKRLRDSVVALIIGLYIFTLELEANSNLPLIGDEDEMPDRKTPGKLLSDYIMITE